MTYLEKFQINFPWWIPHKNTVDGESFAGLNFRGFDPMKYFVEILSRFIGQEHLCYVDNY